MSRQVRRGYSPEDERDFAGPALLTLKRAAQDMVLLLNRGYPSGSAATFVGDHYRLSQRQRVALKRAVSSKDDIAGRVARQKNAKTLAGGTVNIDGFNAIIMLEVALSGSPALRCMDGTFRDLAGLRGTYRLIDKTDIAVRMIVSALKKFQIKRAVFWLDAPVSNSGRLKARIAGIAGEEGFDVGIEVVNNVDKTLYRLPNVVSSDSVILDRCLSWLNLNEHMIPGIPGVWMVDFSK
jgi:hypothetical protein